MFSKIKIVHNYFEEFQGDFKELVIKAINNAKNTPEAKDSSLQKEINNKAAAYKSKEKIEQEALNLSLTESYCLILRHSKTIKQYFSINNVNVTDFEDTVREALINPRQKDFPASIVVSTDQQLQGMMLTLFNKQMGSWESELGKQIDSVLQSNCSELLKATLLAFFFGSFDISKEVHRMLQFHPDYWEIAG